MSKSVDNLDRLWNAIISLAEYQKAIPIKDKVWLARVGSDVTWTIVVNGTQHDHVHDGYNVGAYNCAVWFGDWLAASFSPFEGIIAAGSLANIDTLLDAIRQEMP